MCVFCMIEPIIFRIRVLCIWLIILLGLVTIIVLFALTLGEYCREREKVEIEEEKRPKPEAEEKALAEREPLFIEDVVITNLAGNVLWSYSKGRGELRARAGEETIMSIIIRNRSNYKLSAYVRIDYDSNRKPAAGVKPTITPTITVLPHKCVATKFKLIIPEYGRQKLCISLEEIKRAIL